MGGEEGREVQERGEGERVREVKGRKGGVREARRVRVGRMMVWSWRYHKKPQSLRRVMTWS